MDDWLAPAARAARDARAGAVCCARRAADPAAVDGARRAARRAPRPRRSSPAPAPTATPAGARCVALAERLALPGLAGAVRRPAPASRRTTRCSPGHLPGAPRAAARHARAVRPRAGRRHRRVPPVPVRAAARSCTPARASPSSPQDPDEAHRSPAELAVLGDPGRGLPRRSPSRSTRDARPTRRRCAAPRAAGAAAPRRAAARRPRARRARRAPAARRGRCVEETPSSRPELHARDRRPRAPLGFVSADGRCSASRSRPRSGCAWRSPDRPVLAVVGDGSSLYAIQALWSAATLRRRRAVRRARQRRLRDHGPARRAQRRRRPVAADRRRRHRRDRAGASAATRVRIESHDELLARPRRELATSRDRDTPLLLEVVVAPDATFEP